MFPLILTVPSLIGLIVPPPSWFLLSTASIRANIPSYTLSQPLLQWVTCSLRAVWGAFGTRISEDELQETPNQDEAPLEKGLGFRVSGLASGFGIQNHRA